MTCCPGEQQKSQIYIVAQRLFALRVQQGKRPANAILAGI
jgi:hypothetical protein